MTSLPHLWITDLLPDTLAKLVEGFMEQGGGDQTDTRNGLGQRFEREEAAAAAVRRTAPGENPITRLNVRLNAASDS